MIIEDDYMNFHIVSHPQKRCSREALFNQGNDYRKHPEEDGCLFDAKVSAQLYELIRAYDVEKTG